ncbi:hypothetical protein [Candidatus Nitrosotalea okcheonensis]|uniref:HTH marR-type domain-containing protein n=1 Tax=Candidatus Nitrosotalea okcheonensis TaxID=1903276 RepID=A0A2H1FC56_9ARCH|nr:hypothetical protein [Candidatus Nitrosotalea okcheonensis]SMH70341.1 protein of unknown function [Candidatus Nitrosotalea okcheonensis]
MASTFRMEPYETRSIAKKILEGISQGKTISQISHEHPKIASTTIRNSVRRLEEAGFIE